MRKPIRQYMHEGYTSAGIVSGDKHFEQSHREYVPQLIETLKETNPNAKVTLYYSKSLNAEITGWNGKLYEIKNKQGNSGQATFKIYNFFNIDNPFAKEGSDRPFLTISPNL